ncbi:fosfomycin resistance glutathione transferase [Xanthomonas medicagonis]|uniref:fosfomycin resistance glutathione transferase n=1 Tax=Xanthomonas medicagonis TaxID=3160841 RepID=UPI0035137215
MLTGLNHLTLAVRALPRSVAFYRDTLGFVLRARWDTGAYLTLDALWLCLSLDPQRRPAPQPDYTHYAFSIPHTALAGFEQRLQAAGAQRWQQNRSEGESLYFLDPDGHRLEAHVGDLQSRLAACRERPYAGMQFFD